MRPITVRCMSSRLLRWCMLARLLIMWAVCAFGKEVTSFLANESLPLLLAAICRVVLGHRLLLRGHAPVVSNPA